MGCEGDITTTSEVAVPSVRTYVTPSVQHASAANRQCNRKKDRHSNGRIVYPSCIGLNTHFKQYNYRSSSMDDSVRVLARVMTRGWKSRCEEVSSGFGTSGFDGVSSEEPGTVARNGLAAAFALLAAIRQTTGRLGIYFLILYTVYGESRQTT